MVVLAGYPTQMDELMKHNPGVRSRFPTVIRFDDYNEAELMQIATDILGKEHMTMTPDAVARLATKLVAMVKRPNVENGNGRAVRNMVDEAISAQALRLAPLLADDQAIPHPSELSKLSAEDFGGKPKEEPDIKQNKAEGVSLVAAVGIGAACFVAGYLLQ